ncbi:MAG: LysM peptidoglycan-binding domain-containing protein [Pirellulaceae bacterium]
MLREAQIGLLVFVILVAILAYFGYRSMNSKWSRLANRFADSQPAISIPAEDLPYVRHPQYKLPDPEEAARERLLATTPPWLQNSSKSDSIIEVHTENQVAAVGSRPPIDSGSFGTATEVPIIQPTADEPSDAISMSASNSTLDFEPGKVLATSFEEDAVDKPETVISHGDGASNPQKFSDMESIAQSQFSPTIEDHSGDGSTEFENRLRQLEPVEKTPENDVSSFYDASVIQLDSSNGFRALETKKDVPEPFAPLGMRPLIPFDTNQAEERFDETSIELQNRMNDKTDFTSPTFSDSISDNTRLSRDLVKLESDETFWSLAEKQYGDGRYFRALYQANIEKYLDREALRAGDELLVPLKSQLKNRFAKWIPADLLDSREQVGLTNPNASKSNNSYVVQPNDTLFSIARDQLGQASRYVEIIDLNREVLAEGIGSNSSLPIATELTLPIK